MGKKSDDDDATRLARKHQAGELQEVYVGTPEIRTMRDIVRQHEFLKTRWVSANNNLKHFLNRWNFETAATRGAQRKPDVYCESGRTQVLEQFPHLAGLYAVIDVIHEEMTNLKKQMEGIGKGIPEVRLLQSIPGFGPIVSLALYTEVATIERFQRAEQLVRYFGLDPLHGSSGDKHWDHHRISKKGTSFIRGLLAQGAWSHVTFCPESDITGAYQRLVARGKTKQQAITMVMRRLVKAAFWVLKDERDFTINRPARSASCRNSIPD